ncbi:flagellar basal body rod C-terminal domain-containing protein [uncultured Desulfobacter sp.]|uniref:flagellar basal body rod C-terminal domain-containing protein n=1 Tax=uncultured Desulfobacter sp. TaxID=240139 RepID=UPI0029F4FF36|nr:flagellar basal body rod C-terminal domain-containing protein [uncultured Desulfobacter sp.]
MDMTIRNNASALRAFSNQMQVSASNVANALSDEFKADRAYNVEGENGQVQTSISETQASAPMVEAPLKTNASLKDLSNTDIAEEMVVQIQAQNGFDANAKMIETYEETTGTLLDTLV